MAQVRLVTVIQTAFVQVFADTEEEAEQAVKEMIKDDDGCICFGDPEIVVGAAYDEEETPEL